jgi:hypothetical protein
MEDESVSPSKQSMMSELALARDLLLDAEMNVSDELLSEATVEIAKACHAIAHALAQIERSLTAHDIGLSRFLAERRLASE